VNAWSVWQPLLAHALANRLRTVEDDSCCLGDSGLNGCRVPPFSGLGWSQNLRHHPHLHCLVPSGGLALDNSRWVATKPNFFLPVHVLSCMFRGKILAFLKQAYTSSRLRFPGTLADLAQPRPFRSLLNLLRHKKWVVHSKPPFGGPEQVLKYLTRYTHRVAISNGRLLSLDNGQVRFSLAGF
jgi:Putative transposase